MSQTTLTAPFRADHVGSLLRPKNLLQARKDYQNGNITKDDLRLIENQELKRIVDKQIEVGLELVTDGEFRRSWWHIDFLENLNGFEGYVPERGIPFQGIETEPYDVRNTGKISFNLDHPFLEDFRIFNDLVAGRAVAKQTIPSPDQLFHRGIRNPEVYPTVQEYADDIIQAYRDALKAFYDAGVRYLQFDDVYIAGLNADSLVAYEPGLTREELIDLALYVANGVLKDKPDDLYVTTHLCRGNYESRWAFEGSYAQIAPTLFAKENVDGFFLEYDDERSGDFKPLQHIPDGGPKVVLGLVTSKFGELEDKETIKRRIEEASKYVPLEQLALSPQCGFSSTHHGNKLTEEQQWEKLRFIVEITKEIWG
ncbi:5-methyltetrahydropteroyltriglutamate--homocysteine S-methyltransferase [Ornithinibacillus halotolerans]|uniref:5-methyltetrahydropteroyltriglutamate--homocysteine methyltransferase n=1 Tax=Ornithinibacillus halotolerans TaxID=1274357 RepID=A0A916WBF6_9BACI|nr:5-methyltetrahydropteroyltriglutamate--homocysteine S-methyltransferase [Ornithinibacillus halotolerans]GGA85347.1 5-methyltetrahydropteroyltriglutamate--homocysteine methyltransferase [Ornithinibacillus halotolerans]